MGYFFYKMDCQSNAQPSEKDHDLPGIRTRDLWISSQHTQPLHHLGRHPKKLKTRLKTQETTYYMINESIRKGWLQSFSNEVFPVLLENLLRIEDLE
jgi:hypothetical protein